MLKIKDNVDLKELEKYGYLQGQDMLNVSFNCYGKICSDTDGLLDIVEINKKTREIELIQKIDNHFREFVNNDINLLKLHINDLIKADMVENEELQAINQQMKEIGEGK